MEDETKEEVAESARSKSITAGDLPKEGVTEEENSHKGGGGDVEEQAVNASKTKQDDDDGGPPLPEFVQDTLKATASDNEGAGIEDLGLSDSEYETALEEHGYNEVVVKEKPVWMQIASRYLGIVPLFITTTAVLSAAIESSCFVDPNNL